MSRLPDEAIVKTEPGWLGFVHALLHPPSLHLARAVLGLEIDYFVVAEASMCEAAYRAFNVPIYVVEDLDDVPAPDPLPHDVPGRVRVPETNADLQRFTGGLVRVQRVAEELLPPEAAPDGAARRVVYHMVGEMLLMDREADARSYARLVKSMPPVYCKDTGRVYRKGDTYKGPPHDGERPPSPPPPQFVPRDTDKWVQNLWRLYHEMPEDMTPEQAEERLQYWKEIQRLTAAEEDLKT